MSKWPWVSRELFEETKRQLDAADKERLRLLDLLLGAGGRPAPSREPSSAPIAQRAEANRDVDDGIRPVTEKREEPEDMPNFSTPFDRTLARFDRAFHGGARPPAEFKARMH